MDEGEGSMTFDYTNHTEEIWELVETLDNRQMKQVEQQIREFKEKDEQERKHRYLDWLESALTPVLDELAEENSLYLDLTRKGDGLYVILKKEGGFHISNLGSGKKLMLAEAKHVDISMDNEMLQIQLWYTHE